MKIKILNRFYDLSISPQVLNLPSDTNWGIIDHTKGEITLNNKVNLALKFETLLHECIHSIDNQLELDIDEKLTSKLACGMYSIINDNDWIAIKEFLEKK